MTTRSDMPSESCCRLKYGDENKKTRRAWCTTGPGELRGNEKILLGIDLLSSLKFGRDFAMSSAMHCQFLRWNSDPA
jgi:hypothetical protein